MKHVCCSCGSPTDNEKFIGRTALHVCDNCEERIHREVKWESAGEHYGEDVVIRPYCDHAYERYESYEFGTDGADEIECECCGRKFDLEVRVVRTFTTKRSLCEMPDDWDGTDDE